MAEGVIVALAGKWKCWDTQHSWDSWNSIVLIREEERKPKERGDGNIYEDSCENECQT